MNEIGLRLAHPLAISSICRRSFACRWRHDGFIRVLHYRQNSTTSSPNKTILCPCVCVSVQLLLLHLLLFITTFIILTLFTQINIIFGQRIGIIFETIWTKPMTWIPCKLQRSFGHQLPQNETIGSFSFLLFYLQYAWTCFCLLFLILSAVASCQLKKVFFCLPNSSFPPSLSLSLWSVGFSFQQSNWSTVFHFFRVKNRRSACNFVTSQ